MGIDKKYTIHYSEYCEYKEIVYAENEELARKEFVKKLDAREFEAVEVSMDEFVVEQE